MGPSFGVLSLERRRLQLLAKIAFPPRRYNGQKEWNREGKNISTCWNSGIVLFALQGTNVIIRFTAIK
jgi:hypothetical protein